MSAISFRPAKDADLAWVEGQIHLEDTSATSIKDLPGGGDHVSPDTKELHLVPVLDAVSSAEVRMTWAGISTVSKNTPPAGQRSQECVCESSKTL